MKSYDKQVQQLVENMTDKPVPLRELAMQIKSPSGSYIPVRDLAGHLKKYADKLERKFIRKIDSFGHKYTITCYRRKP